MRLYLGSHLAINRYALTSQGPERAIMARQGLQFELGVSDQPSCYHRPCRTANALLNSRSAPRWPSELWAKNCKNVCNNFLRLCTVFIHKRIQVLFYFSFAANIKAIFSSQSIIPKPGCPQPAIRMRIVVWPGSLAAEEASAAIPVFNYADEYRQW